MKKVLIIGGGIGGLCTAIALLKKGLAVEVYESAPELKPLGAGLVLAANAMQGLRKIGLEEEILVTGKLLSKIQILAQDGDIITQTDTTRISQRYGTNNFAIHRADLHRILQQHIPAQQVITGKKCVDVVQDAQGVTATFSDGSLAQGDCLVAADGIHSLIRKKLVPGSSLRYAGHTCWRAVTDTYPQSLDTSKFTETWGAKGRFGIVPLAGNRVYWYACINAPVNDSQMAAYTLEDLASAFRHHHAPIPQLIEMTQPNQLIRNDINDIAPLRQFAFGKIVLTGDAAHATTPNMGQGACQAIEDAIVLANCLSRNVQPEAAFKEFERKRIGRTTQIANASRQIGQIAQWSNPLLCKLRNKAFQLIPASLSEKQLEFLYKVDF